MGYEAPRGSISKLDFEMLAAHKPELLLYLKAQQAATLPPFTRASGAPAPSLVQEMWWKWIDRSISLIVPIVEFFENADTLEVAHALRDIVAKHEALRSSFSDTNGILGVVLNPSDEFEIESQVVTSRRAVENHVEEFLSRPLRGDSPWLTRAKIIVSPGTGCTAVLAINHLIADAGSVGIIRKELFSRLRSREGFSQAGARQKVPQHSDFAIWQRNWFELSGQPLIEYWRNCMHGKRNPISPQSSNSMNWRPGSKVYHKFSLPIFAQQAIASVARDLSTSTFIVYLSIYAISVARWSGFSRFMIRSLYDERTIAELDSIVGLMVSADAVAIDVDSKRDFHYNLRMIEASYALATTVRLPTMYAYPPYIVGGNAICSADCDNIGIVLNFSEQRAGYQSTQSDATWPPKIIVSEPKVWPHAVSAIALDIWDGAGRFHCHEEILSRTEQLEFIDTFFRTVEEAGSLCRR